MIKGSKELTEKLRYRHPTDSTKIVADHFGVPTEDVEWRDFRKPGWHMDPPGRFFIKGEPLKLYLITPWEKESEE